MYLRTPFPRKIELFWRCDPQKTGLISACPYSKFGGIHAVCPIWQKIGWKTRAKRHPFSTKNPMFAPFGTIFGTRPTMEPDQLIPGPPFWSHFWDSFGRVKPIVFQTPKVTQIWIKIMVQKSIEGYEKNQRFHFKQKNVINVHFWLIFIPQRPKHRFMVRKTFSKQFRSVKSQI